MELADFQKKFHLDHPEFIDASAPLVTAAMDIFDTPLRSPLQERDLVARHLAQSVVSSFQSIQILTYEGHGADAMCIVRSMLERTVALVAFEQFPTMAEDYCDFRWIKKWKSYQRARGTHLDVLPDEQVRELESKYNTVVGKFTLPRGGIRGSWYACDLRTLCDQIDKSINRVLWVPIYDAAYRVGSDFEHGDIAGLERQVDIEKDPYNLDLPPSDNFITPAISTAHWLTLAALVAYVSITGIDKGAVTAQIHDTYKKVWDVGSREHTVAKKGFDDTVASL
jgi:hypothetical protein